jgi:hypothetical protein
VSTLESLFRSIGLLWERLHIISGSTVQTAGLTSAWTQDLIPIGERAVATGELVEFYVTLEHDHVVAALPKIRFDVLEFDWLFFGGFDDPLVSVKTEAADPPEGGFTLVERQLSEDDFSGGLSSIEDVVAGYRFRHAEDFERGILVVRESDLPDVGRTHVIGWWRAQHADEDKPSLYFVADVAGIRDSSTVPLTVAPPTPGANVRLFGRITDDEPADAADAQAVPGATITVGGRTTRTDRGGHYVADARLPHGTSTMRIARPGIEDRTVTVQVTPAAAGGLDVVILDPAANNAELHRGSVAADADPQSALVVELDLRARVHKLRGVVTWPETRATAAANPPITLSGRRVCALALAAGATALQRPSSTSDWEALAARPDVLRSARPGRARDREATDVDGSFELSFIDLRPGAQYLIWVECDDPRTADGRVPEVIVRTAAAPRMRAMTGDHANQLEHVDRRVVDSRHNLLPGSAAGAVDILRVFAPAAGPVQMHRPGRVDPAGIDASPPAGTEAVAVDLANKRATGLVLEVLPLIPIHEDPDAQGPLARWATRALGEQLDAAYPRGHLLGELRWVLDARRADALRTPFDSPTTLGLLEETLLTQPKLTSAQLNDPAWNWWRIDTNSLADYAQAAIAPNGPFAGRRLLADLVPVLHPALPRLTGLFPRRSVVVAPGHGLFSEPPVAAAGAAGLAQQLTARGGWNFRAGEDENAAVVAIELIRAISVNGATPFSSRESEDLTLPGVVQTAADTFVDSPLADFPRLWQQNAYYWLATRWDPAHAGQEIVIGHSGQSIAPTPPPQGGGAIDPNTMRKNGAGLDDRITLFRQLAARPAGVDAFVAIHTNGSDDLTVRGTLSLYLDIRQTVNDPPPPAHNAPSPNYQETNAIGLRFADLIADVTAAALRTRNRGPITLYANGNPVKELRDTVTHHRTGTAVQATRTTVAGAGTAQVNFPRVRGRDIPIGYVEVAFHSNADDGALLARRWFRHAAAVALATATETMIGEHDEAITRDDLKALLGSVFGPTAAVAGLADGDDRLAVADIQAAITTVTGQAVNLAQPQLGLVVAAVESARDAATRRDLVERLSRTLAIVAGYDPNDPNQADGIARAALAPLLGAGGAEPAPDAVPAIGDLPRAGVAVTRADAAMFLAAGLGLRPVTLAAVTRPIGQVTLLPALAQEVPEAFVPGLMLDAAITEAGRLRPEDVWRPTAAQLTDSRQNPLPAPARLVPGAQVRVVVDLAGTAWPGTASDVELVLTVGAIPVATVGCEQRTSARLVSRVWPVRMPAGLAGPQDVAVGLRVRRGPADRVSLGPVTVRVVLGAGTASNGAGGRP